VTSEVNVPHITSNEPTSSSTRLPDLPHLYKAGAGIR